MRDLTARTCSSVDDLSLEPSGRAPPRPQALSNPLPFAADPVILSGRWSPHGRNGIQTFGFTPVNRLVTVRHVEWIGTIILFPQGER